MATDLGKGFFLHSSLLVSDATGEIAGLAAQELFYRIKAPKGEGSIQRKKRKRESEVWGRVVDQVGSHSLVLGLSTFAIARPMIMSFFCHTKLAQAGWIARAQHKHRFIHRADDLQSNSPTLRKNAVT